MKTRRLLRGALLRSALFFGAILNLSVLGAADAQPLKTHPALRRITPGSERSERFLTRGPAGEVLVDLIVVGDVAPGLLRSRGIEVQTVAGRHMTARCPLGLLEALAQTPGVERIQVAERAAPDLDRSLIDARAAALHPIHGSTFSGITGSGVVIGIVDTGIDWEHPDFHRRDGHSRLIALWDQTSPVGTRPPGFTYGAYYDSMQIRLGLLDESDTAGHGTHVAGIAAGDGSATGFDLPEFTYVGVAPEADLIAVKTNFNTTSIVDGVKFVFDQAAALGRQAVVNLSLGTQDGPHDGTYDMDLMISALAGPGRIVVASAGNSGASDLHGRVPVTTESAMTLSVPSYTPKAESGNDYLLFSGWYPGGDRIAVSLVTPAGVTVGPVSRGQEREENTPDGYVFVSNGKTLPANGDNEIYIEIYDRSESLVPKTGTWTFHFDPVQAPEAGYVDMYLHQSQLGGGAPARWVQGLMRNGVIGSPGTADSVITVGAHTTRSSWTSINGSTYSYGGSTVLDALAPFSSAGPRRDGVRKPDLSAPGHGIMSPKSSDYAAGTNGISPDGVHVLMSGTSMAAPHVTGAVALLLQRSSWAGSGPTSLRDRLRATGRGDSYTGALPNDGWGFGKLDVTAAVLGQSVTTVEEEATAEWAAPRFALAANAPNPFNPSTRIRFELPEAGLATLRVYSPAGRLVRTLVRERLAAGPHEVTWNGRDDGGRPMASGVYLYELAAGEERQTRKMSLLQ
jgi:minor extracellular serine protease Vpr